MKRTFRRSKVLLSHRALCVTLAGLMTLLGCPITGRPLAPTAGLVSYQAPAWVTVPGGVVNAAGGNLIVARRLLSIDTRLGTRELGAVYNSASGRWRFSFELEYHGGVFTDPTGAAVSVGELADGAPIPGTRWVRGDATRIESRGGLVYVFEAGGRLASEHWADAPYPQLVYETEWIAGAERTARILQCTAASDCSEVFEFHHDAQGRLERVEDRAGRTALLSWDPEGRLVTARDALDVEEGWPGQRYTYAGSKLTSLTTSEGERTDWAWAGERLASATAIGEEHPRHSFSYQPAEGGLYTTRHWDPSGHEHRVRYDAQGRVQELESVDDEEVTRLSWTGLRPASRTEPSGATQQFSWAEDELVTRVDPSGNVVRALYTPHAVDRDDPWQTPVLRIEDDLGLVEERTYDGQGRLSSVSNGAGEVTSRSYAADGSLASVTDPSGRVRTFSDYGEHGHARRVEIAGAIETRVFDAVGNRVRGSDGSSPERGGVAERAFDAGRNLRRVTLVAQAGTLPTGSSDLWIDVRSDGQPTAILRPGGGDHEFSYDAVGRLVTRSERVSGEWRTTHFEVDASGRQTAVERPNGMREERDYDAAGRLVALRAFRNGVPEASATFRYAAGLLAEIDDSTHSGVERYEYDGAGRRVRVTHPDGSSTLTEYDLRSRITGQIFVADTGGVPALLIRGYDAADRETFVSNGAEAWIERRYVAGQLAETRTANGLTRTHSWDPAGTGLRATDTTNANGNLLERTVVERSVLDGVPGGLRILAVTATVGDVTLVSSEEYRLGPLQDPAQPLTQAGARVGIWSDGASVRSFDYDALGNRIGGDFAYNAEANRLLAATSPSGSSLTYQWDAAGFATSRAGVPITWTALGRVSSIGADHFEWDLLGRPLAAEVGGIASTWRFGGAIQADAAGVPVALDLGELRLDLAGGNHLYRHLDFRGNVKLVSDASGRIVSHYRYSPYGLEAVHGADDDPVRFVGRAEIGELMILGERIYDPAIGRFLSPDPVFQLVNQFTYTLGNPVWFSDPDGRESGYTASEVAGVIAATFGLLAAVAAIFMLTPFAVTFGAIAAIHAWFAAVLAMVGAPVLHSFGPVGASAGAAASAGGGGASAPGGGGGGFGCSPTALTDLPETRGALGWLLPLQALLGLAWLRRRRLRGPVR